MTGTTSTKLGRLILGAVLFSLPMTSGPSQARELSDKEVAAAVQTWVRKVPAEARPDAVIEKIEACQTDGKTVAYIAHLSGGGYCICGTHTDILPVYLYSLSGRFDPNDPDLPFFLESIPKHRLTVQALRKERSAKSQQYTAKLTQREADWQSLIDGEAPVSRTPMADGETAPTKIELPANSYWSQGGGEGGPFGEACPALPPGGTKHCVTGCVATASSQIMYYWKWPATGEGTAAVSYEYRYSADWLAEPLATDPELDPSWETAGLLKWESTNGGELKMMGYWDGSMYSSAANVEAATALYYPALSSLWYEMPTFSSNHSANPGTATYQWDLMLDSYAGIPFSDPAAIAVANLCRDVAITESMDFGVWGSSAGTSSAVHALVNHFRYDPDAVYGIRVNDTMIEEIKWLRPIQVRGSDEYGAGHSWMTCGYDTGPEPDLFRVNRGHGGGSDEWLAVDDYWAYGQWHVTHIAPLGVVRFVGSLGPGDGSPDSPFRNIAAALSTVDDGTTLIFKAGTTNTFSTTSLTIDRPMTLKGCQATIQRQ